MSDKLISFQAVIDLVSYSIVLCNKALDSMTLGGRDRYAVETERNSLLKLKDDIKMLPTQTINNLPSAQPEKAQLSTEGTTNLQPTCNKLATDTVSRQAAIDAMCSACGYECDKSECIYNAPQDEQVILCPEHYALTQLPSAQPDKNVLEQEYLKGWEDGRKNLLDAVSGTLKDFCDQCGEGKKYNGVMCGACNLDSWISVIEEMKCTIEGKPNER